MMILLWVTLLSQASWAKTAPKTFTIMVKVAQDKTWYRIHQEGKSWICQTKHFPFFEAPENPLRDLDWKALEAEAKAMPKACAYPVSMKNELLKKSKTIVTCATQKHTEALYARISEHCRSKI